MSYLFNKKMIWKEKETDVVQAATTFAQLARNMGTPIVKSHRNEVFRLIQV
jgi:hypothetical protein